MKSFAILVISYKGKRYLEDCFSMLGQNTSTELADLYLIDNNSQDGTEELMNDKFPGVTVIQTNSNMGFSGGYNFAHKQLKKAGKQYTYYLILNQDTELRDAKLLTRIARLFETDPTIGIINPTIVDGNDIIQFQGGRYLFWTGTTLSYRQGQAYTRQEAITDSKWSTGCALFIRPELFERVGGFDDYFMYQEDAGLSWKVLNLDYRVIADCSSSIVHHAGYTTKITPFEHYYSERNRIIAYYQNLAGLTFWLVIPILLFSRLVLMIIQLDLPIIPIKLKANLVGLRMMFKYPKYNHSVSRDLKTINYFHTRYQKVFGITN